MGDEIDSVPVGISQQRAHAAISPVKGAFSNLERQSLGLPDDRGNVAAAEIQQVLGNVSLREPNATVAGSICTRAGTDKCSIRAQSFQFFCQAAVRTTGPFFAIGANNIFSIGGGEFPDCAALLGYRRQR